MKLPIPSDWSGGWCRWSICWPDSPMWRIILAGLITSPIKGRLWDERTGAITSVQDVGRQILEKNLPLEECIMACSDLAQLGVDIRYLADKIAAAIGTSTCGSGTAGTGGTGQEESGNDTGEPGNHIGDPPTGFSTWEEYDTYKCAVAVFVVNQLIQDFRNMSSGQFVAAGGLSGVVSILAFTLATPIPGDELLVIAGLIISALSAGVLSEVTSDAAEALEGVEDDLVCALFLSPTVSGSRGAFEEVAGQAFDDQLSAIAASTAKTMVSYMLSNDSLNRLYVKDDKRTYPTGDCGNCESCVLMVVDWGDKTGELSAGSLPDGVYEGKIKVLFGVTQSEVDCGPALDVSISLSGFTPEGGNPWKAVQAYGDIAGAVVLHNEDTPWVGVLEGVKRVDLYSSTEFSVSFTQA